MKKVCGLWVAICLLVLIWPAAALAKGDTTIPNAKAADPSPAPEGTELASSVSFAIDNQNIYEGMTKSYREGYIPIVENGRATVMLPLTANGEIKGNAMTVTPNLGERSASPFVFKNYQKTVGLNANAVNGGASTVTSFLIRFDLELTSGRINGVYPVAIDVQAQAADGSPVQQSFTCYVTITDGKKPVSEEAPKEPEVEKPTSEPKIIVSGYSVNPSVAVAGEEFTVSITLKNTSSTKSVQNMAVTVSSDSPNLALLNDSNVLYIDKLDKGATTDIELRYKTDLETPPQRYNITLAMEYDNADAATLASSGTVTVTIGQPLRVELKAPQVASEVNAGDTMPLTFQVMNLSRSMIYNVRVEVSAAGLIPSGTAFIGNMEAGTAGEAALDVFVGTKDMTQGYEGEEKYGFTSGMITLVYEDAAGQEYTEDMEISTTISAPVIAQASIEPEDEPEKAGQWWISIVMGAVVIGGLVSWLVVKNKKARANSNEGI